MKRLFSLFLALMIALNVCACGADDISDQVANIAQMEDEHVRGVKGGIPNAYPDKTYGEAFDSFFAAPTWKYFVGTKEGPDEDGDGKPDYTEENVDVVEFTGYCTYQDVEVKARIQFTLDKDGDTFSATYLSFNEVPQNMLMLSALLTRVFEGDEAASDAEYEDSLASETTDYEEEMDYSEEETDYSQEESGEYEYGALAYAGVYQGWGGYRISFSAYSSVEGTEVGVAEIFYEDDFIGTYSVYICEDKGDWEGWDYDQFYVMHMDGYDEYLGFYQQDGVYMLDYNSETRNTDTMEMVEHFES